MINFDDFKKVELKVGRVMSAESVEGSEKLLKLEIDLGSDPSTGSGQEKRQIVSGIAAAYTADSLKGKQVVVVTNLEPRTLMGLESQGMLLAARNEEGKPVILTLDGDVTPGTLVS